MTPEERRLELKSLRTKELLWISLFVFLEFLFILYIIFGKGYLINMIVYVFMVLTVFYIIYLLKDLQPNPDNFFEYQRNNQSNYGQFYQHPQIQKREQFEDFSRLQFSQQTKKRAMDILNRSMVRNKEAHSIHYLRPEEKEERGMDSNNKWNTETEQVHYRNTYEKSVLDEIPLEHPNSRFKDSNSSRLRPKRENTSRILGNRRLNLSSLRKETNKRSRLNVSRDMKATLTRYSHSIGKNTLRKSSKQSRSFIHREQTGGMDEYTEKQNIYNESLEKLKINFKKYDFWTMQHIQNWLACTFFPEIVNANKENLKNIDMVLRVFGKSLKEYRAMKSIFDEMHSESFLTSSFRHHQAKEDPIQSNFRLVSLGELLSYSRRSYGRWENDFGLVDLNNRRENRDKLKELEHLLAERNYLDQYIEHKDFDIEIIRLPLLKKLVRLQNNGFISELNNEMEDMYTEYPEIENILLTLFVVFIANNDRYYSVNRNSKYNIFIDEFLEYGKKSDTDFMLRRSSYGNIVIYCGNQMLENELNLDTVFSIMVLFTHHVKKYHGQFIKGLKEGAFKELITKFDIAEDR